jgi:DtxR family Mn-dependent transcriptional regulator
MLSKAVQDYLKAIYKLQELGGAVTTSALAEEMEVTAASTTGMVKKLASLKLVKHSPYQGVILTKAGQKMALEVIRHHRLLELYLAEALGYTWDKVHEEAERLEHVISEEFEEKIFEALGRPTRDPHGDPIPSKDGTVITADHERLSDLEPGAGGVIRQVSNSDAEMLRYLGQRGLVPDTALEVVDKAPFNGPLTVRAGRTSHVLGRELARHIWVEAAPSHSGHSPAGSRAPSAGSYEQRSAR